MSQSPLPRPARIAGSALVIALGVVLVFAFAAIVWVGARGAIAASNLRSAEAEARTVIEQIGDPAAVADTISTVAQRAATARELTSDPMWRALETLPWIGPQLSAVSTLAASADQIAGGLTPLVDVASTLTPAAMRPQDGRIALDGFVSVQDAANAAADDIGGAVDAVQGLPTAPLLGPVRDVVVEAQDTLSGVGSATESLANAARLLPAMLGADGPRNYLVLFQNNAEWRSLGGIAGSAALIHTDGGTMQLVAQDFAANFPRVAGGVAPLDTQAQAIFGARPAEWFHNVTQVPDFSVSGALARDMWARKHGVAVDGVVSIDPVALSYLLEATGPLTLQDGTTLDSENAVALLLNEVYVRFEEPKAQNAFFDAATGGVFTALTDGRADPAKLLTALARAGEENRLLLWSAHAEDQEVLADTTLAGGLPITDENVSTFGVFLNDGTGSKMDYYQSVETSVAWDSCIPRSGKQATGTATLTTTIANDAPVEGLAEYITGDGAYGVVPGSASTVAYLYLPEGATLAEATLTDPRGDDLGFGGGTHDGRRVLSFETLLSPGESATATVTVQFDRPASEKVAVLQTPTVNGKVATPVAACL